MPQDTDDLRANLPGLVRSKASSASRLSSGISSRFLEVLTEGLTIGDLDGGRDGPSLLLALSQLLLSSHQLSFHLLY